MFNKQKALNVAVSKAQESSVISDELYSIVLITRLLSVIVKTVPAGLTLLSARLSPYLYLDLHVSRTVQAIA